MFVLNLLVTLSKLSISTPNVMSRVKLDDSFLRKILDKDWEKSLQKTPNCFLFLHADNNRIPDAGYLRFIEVARKYKDKAIFYVIPIISGDKTARKFAIPGFPALYHISNKTDIKEFIGSFSSDNMDRFISSFISQHFTDIDVSDSESIDAVYRRTRIDEYDSSDVIFMLSNNETKFGRASIDLSEAIHEHVQFLRISDEKIAKSWNFRFPSLVLYRNQDRKPLVYIGEPTTTEMISWYKSLPKPEVRKYNMNSLFEKDGHSKKTLVKFIDDDSEIPSLNEISFDKSKISMVYAKPIQMNALLTLFGYDKAPKQLCIATNFSKIGYAECDDISQFSDGNLPFKYIKTPIEAFDRIALVNELGMKDLLVNGPLFVIFTLRGSDKCAEFTEEAVAAAEKILYSGGKIPWSIYDVYKETPSFRSDVRLTVPSVVYFESENLTNHIDYKEQPNYMLIADWAAKQEKDVNLDNMYQSDPQQYDSL